MLLLLASSISDAQVVCIQKEVQCNHTIQPPRMNRHSVVGQCHDISVHHHWPSKPTLNEPSPNLSCEIAGSPSESAGNVHNASAVRRIKYLLKKDHHETIRFTFGNEEYVPIKRKLSALLKAVFCTEYHTRFLNHYLKYLP